MNFLTTLDEQISKQTARLTQLQNDYNAVYGALQAFKQTREIYVNLQAANQTESNTPTLALFPDGVTIDSPPIGGIVG